MRGKGFHERVVLEQKKSPKNPTIGTGEGHLCRGQSQTKGKTIAIPALIGKRSKNKKKKNCSTESIITKGLEKKHGSGSNKKVHIGVVARSQILGQIGGKNGAAIDNQTTQTINKCKRNRKELQKKRTQEGKRGRCKNRQPDSLDWGGLAY